MFINSEVLLQLNDSPVQLNCCYAALVTNLITKSLKISFFCPKFTLSQITLNIQNLLSMWSSQASPAISLFLFQWYTFIFINWLLNLDFPTVYFLTNTVYFLYR